MVHILNETRLTLSVIPRRMSNHDRTVLVCNACGTKRTLISDESATTFRGKECFNAECPAVGDFRKEIYRALSDELSFEGGLESEIPIAHSGARDESAARSLESGSDERDASG